MTRTEWTPAMHEDLAELWRAGSLTAEIADRLGVTKNAVIGMAHRLRLPKRENPIGKGWAGGRPPVSPGRPKAAPRPAIAKEAPARVSVRREQAKAEQRERSDSGKTLAPFAIRGGFNSSPAPAWLKTCQWIAGEPSGDDSCKCGASTVDGRPYCPPHWARSWSKANGGKAAVAQSRKDEAA